MQHYNCTTLLIFKWLYYFPHKIWSESVNDQKKFLTKIKEIFGRDISFFTLFCAYAESTSFCRNGLFLQKNFLLKQKLAFQLGPMFANLLGQNLGKKEYFWQKCYIIDGQFLC